MHEESNTPRGFRVPRVKLTCRQCDREFEVLASQSLRTGRPFCSLDCANKNKKTSMEARFWKGVQKTDTCWLWMKATYAGYGILPLPGHAAGSVRAHLFSYELRFGPIPKGQHIHHTCPGGPNRACVNPDHLRAGPKPKEPRQPKPSLRPPLVSCVCEQCGEPFSVRPSRFANGKTVKYCGRDCQGKAKARPLEERFWEKVDLNGPLPPGRPELGPCQLWKGARTGQYGAFNGTTAHRVALMLDGRPAPEDGDACHICDVKLCVRKEHLFPGTKPENLEDMRLKGRRGRTGPKGSGQLNPVAVRIIRFMWENRQATQAAMARAYHVHPTTIQRVIRGQSWDHEE